MNNWNLSDKRRDTIIDMLTRQYSLTMIARHYEIHPDTLSRKLKEAGIDHRELQADGIRKMRTNLYADLLDIDDPKDRAKATLDFLRHYDKSDDVAAAKQDVDMRSTVWNVNVVKPESDD